MPQVPAEWEPIEEFGTISAKLIAKYPDRWAGIDPGDIIAYGCTNKDRPENKKNAKPYEMSGETEPESFTNAKKYFVKLYMTDWDARDEVGRQWLVCSALERIDKENPDSGKVSGFDYKDQSVLVRTLGADWHMRGDLPDLLRDDVEFVEEATVKKEA